MNNLLKKVLTIVLSTAMLLSMLTFGGANVVLAEGYVEKPITSTENYEIPEREPESSLVEVDNHYYVTSEDDWTALVELESDLSGKTVVLTDDIAFTKANATLATFAGKLDGNGNTLTGVTQPLINTLNGGATIQNLIVEGNVNITVQDGGVIANTVNVTADIKVSSVAVNATVTGSTRAAAGMFGYIATGTKILSFKDCKVSGSIAGKSISGGFIGHTPGSNMTYTLDMDNCKNSAALSVTGTPGANPYAAGMMAYMGRTAIVIIKNCENAGNINIDATLTNSLHIWAGGLIGRSRTGVTFENCRNTGDITANAKTAGGSAYIGGFIGQVGDGATTTELSGCVNTGNVEHSVGSVTKEMVGGLIAYCCQNTSISNCVNYGTILAGNSATSANGAAGGIVAWYITGALLEVSNTYNMGSVSASDSPAGGIVGQAKKPVSIIGCVNTGDVSSNANMTDPAAEHVAAGIVGGAFNAGADGSSIIKCINTGTVKGANSAAGILGSVQVAATFTIEDCSNSGAVTATTNAGGIIADTTAAVSVSNCIATGAIAGDATNVTITNCTASVSDMAVHNLEAQKSKVADGEFDVLLLGGMNKLNTITEVGFELICIVDGAVVATPDYEPYPMVYTDVYGYDEDGEQVVVNATDYDDVTYLTALKIKGIPTSENVTYLYRAYAVKTVGGEPTTLYSTWSAATFDAVA